MPEEERWQINPWEYIKWGLIGLGITILTFLLISWKENSGGGTMRVHWVVALSYYVGGKWTVAGVIGFVSGAVLVMGVVALFRNEQ